MTQLICYTGSKVSGAVALVLHLITYFSCSKIFLSAPKNLIIGLKVAIHSFHLIGFDIIKHQLQPYLVGALELLQIKIKVSGQGTHCEERSQQERLVCDQRRAVRILMMLNLQLVKCTWGKKKKREVISK